MTGFLFALVAAGILGWWLFARRLTAKPWEALQSAADNESGGALLDQRPAKVGLWFFLAVITSFFGLFISAYGMRMHMGDWQSIAVPDLLWLNTALLVVSSLAFEWARRAAARCDYRAMKAGVAVAGLFAFTFLAGQLVVWRQLNASWQVMAGSVAIAFFIVLSGLHGLHLAGGLVVWGKTMARMWRGDAGRLADARGSVQLCAIYWHFLLVVWLVLFAVLFHTGP